MSVAAQAITHLTDDLEAMLSTTIASAAHSGGENVLALKACRWRRCCLRCGLFTNA